MRFKCNKGKAKRFGTSLLFMIEKHFLIGIDGVDMRSVFNVQKGNCFTINWLSKHLYLETILDFLTFA